MMTRAGGFARGSDHAEAVLGRLNRLIGRQLPEFAINRCQQLLRGGQGFRIFRPARCMGFAHRSAYG